MDYRYRTSKTIATDIATSKPFFLANSLVEKRKYIYFSRGRIGTNGYACGTKKHKTYKKYFTWQETGEVCNGIKKIYKITRI